MQRKEKIPNSPGETVKRSVFRGLPIVFVHYGSSSELSLVLSLAVRRNPNSSVILLGDSGSLGISGVEYFDFHNYFESAGKFEKIYCHLSAYSQQFELFCFQRWFIVRDFMRRHGLKSCFHADSDVLLMGDLMLEKQRLPLCDMTLSFGHAGFCGHNSYINNLHVLEAFCSHVEEEFSKGEECLQRQIGFNRLEMFFELRNNIEPLNDMRLWRSFRQEGLFQFADSARVIDWSTFDHYLGSPQSGYEMEGNAKKFTWKGGFPYCFHARLAIPIRFVSIHCQGPSKAHLSELAQAALTCEACYA